MLGDGKSGGLRLCLELAERAVASARDQLGLSLETRPAASVDGRDVGDGQRNA